MNRKIAAHSCHSVLSLHFKTALPVGVSAMEKLAGSFFLIARRANQNWAIHEKSGCAFKPIAPKECQNHARMIGWSIGS